MHTAAPLLNLTLGLILLSPHQNAEPRQKQSSPARQLAAVRGEVVKVVRDGKDLLLITIRPRRDFAEVTVQARENDPVGSAVGRSGDADLLGLLTGDDREDETLTAAELNEGDVVSVIYDPQLRNKAVEIYLH